MRLGIIFAAALLAGCTALPERAPEENAEAAWAAHASALARVEVWQLRGRLALRSEDEGANASVYWQCDHGRHRLDLAGPFGGGRVRVTRDESGATLRDANGRLYRDASVEALLARVTGWSLPLDGLEYWVRGLPVPDAPRREVLNAWGQLDALDQLGWHISFLDYARQDGHELPSRIFLRRDSTVGEVRTLEVRFVVERWKLGDQPAAPAPSRDARPPRL
jgi:outer membrane lipoprotein LolB